MASVTPLPEKPLSERVNRDKINEFLNKVVAGPTQQTVPITDIGDAAQAGVQYLIFPVGGGEEVFVASPETFVLWDANGDRAANSGIGINVVAVWKAKVGTVTGTQVVAAGPPNNAPTPISLGQVDIMPGSVTIRTAAGEAIDNEILAWDDGLGGFTDNTAQAQDVDAGAVDYTTGEITGLSFTAGSDIVVNFLYDAVQLDISGSEFLGDPGVAYGNAFVLQLDAALPYADYAGAPDNGEITVTYGIKTTMGALPTDAFVKLGAATAASPTEAYGELAKIKGINPTSQPALWNLSPPLQGTTNLTLSTIAVPPDWFSLPEVRDRLIHLWGDAASGSFQKDHYDPPVSPAAYPPFIASAPTLGDPNLPSTAVGVAPGVGYHTQVHHFFPLNTGARIRQVVLRDPAVAAPPAPAATFAHMEEYADLTVNRFLHTFGANADLGALLATSLGLATPTSIGSALIEAGSGAVFTEMFSARAAASSAWRAWVSDGTNFRPVLQAFNNAGALGVTLGHAGVVAATYDRAPGSIGLAPYDGVNSKEIATVGWVLSQGYGTATGGNFVPHAGTDPATLVATYMGNAASPSTTTGAFFGFATNINSTSLAGFHVTAQNPGATLTGGLADATRRSVVKIDNNSLATDIWSSLLDLRYTGAGSRVTGLNINVSGALATAAAPNLATRALWITAPNGAGGRAIEVSDKNGATPGPAGDVFFQGERSGGAKDFYLHMVPNADPTAPLANFVAAGTTGWDRNQALLRVYTSKFAAGSGAPLFRVEASDHTSASPLAQIVSINANFPATASGLNIHVEGALVNNTNTANSAATIARFGFGVDDDVVTAKWALRMDRDLDMGLGGTPKRIRRVANPLADSDATNAKWVHDNFGPKATLGEFVQTGTTGTWYTGGATGGYYWQATLPSRAGAIDTGNYTNMTPYMQFDINYCNWRLSGASDPAAGAPDRTIFSSTGAAPASGYDVLQSGEVTAALGALVFFDNAAGRGDGLVATKGMVRTRIKGLHIDGSGNALTQFVRTKLQFTDKPGAAAEAEVSSIKMGDFYNTLLKNSLTGGLTFASNPELYLATKGYVDEAVKPNVIGKWSVEVTMTTLSKSPIAMTPDLMNRNTGVDGYEADQGIAIWPSNLLFDRATDNPGSRKSYTSFTYGLDDSHQLNADDGTPFSPAPAKRRWRHDHLASSGYIPGQSLSRRNRGGTLAIDPENDLSLAGIPAATYAPQTNRNPNQAEVNNIPAGGNTQWGAATLSSLASPATSRPGTPNLPGQAAAGLKGSSLFYPEQPAASGSGSSVVLSMNLQTTFDVTGAAGADIMLEMMVEKVDVLCARIVKPGSATNGLLTVQPKLRFLFNSLNFTNGGSRSITVTLNFFALKFNHADPNNGTTSTLSVDNMVPWR